MADRFRSLYDDKEQIKRLDKVTILDSEATPLTAEANKKTNVKDLHKKEIFDIDANTTITASQGQIFFNSTKATGTHEFTLNTTSLQVGDTIWIKKSGACDSISLIAGSGVTIRTTQSATEIGDLLIITKIASAVFSCVKIKSEAGTEIPTYNLEQDETIPEQYNVTISGVTTRDDLPDLYYVVFDATDWIGSFPTTTSPYMNVNELFEEELEKFHNSQTTSIFHGQIEPNTKWLIGKANGRSYFVNPPIAEANFITYTTSGTNGIAYSIPLGVNQHSFVAKLNTALITAVSQPTLSFAGGTAYPLLNGYTGDPFTDTTLTVGVAYHFIKDGDFYRVLVPPAGSIDTNIYNEDGTIDTERIVTIEETASIRFEGVTGETIINDDGFEVTTREGVEETKFEVRGGVQNHISDAGIPLKSDAYYPPTANEHYVQKQHIDEVTGYITEYVDNQDNKLVPAIGIFVTATTADSGATYTGTTSTTLATFPKMFNIRGVALNLLTENSTININSTGAIKLRDSNGNVINGALQNNKDYTCYYDNIGDGTTHEYRLLRPLHGLLPDGSFWIKTVFNLLGTFSGTAISGGSFDEVSLGTGSKYTHLAMIKSHASNANSGARTNYSGDKALYPNLMREYIFHIPSVACTTRSSRFGLMRPTYLPSTPPYGVWFDISNLTLSCSCVSTPNTTTHATTYTLALNTTYKAVIEVNTALTSVNFKLFVAGSSTPVLNNNITTNIPTDDALVELQMGIASEGASREIIGLNSWGAGDRDGYNKLD